MEKSITGIVVGKKKHSNEYFIWSPETFVGNDGILQENLENRVEIGNWVEIFFTQNEYDKYFPDRNVEKFYAKNFTVIPPLHETTVDTTDAFGSVRCTIKVKLDLYLTENQDGMEHHFFGKIRNNRGLTFPSGLWTITIKRIAAKIYDTVWVLESVETCRENQNEIQINGIIGGKDQKHLFVWCKERPPGHDVAIELRPDSVNLELGTWITFSVTRLEFDQHFPKQISRNGFVPRYYLKTYDVIENVYPTFVDRLDGKTIKMELECWIDKEKEIWHPTVGLILNEQVRIHQSGKYSITIIRLNKNKKLANGPIKSVWYLDDVKLLEVVKTEQPKYASMLDLTRNTEQSTSSYSRLQQQSKYFAQSEINISSPIPVPRMSMEGQRLQEKQGIIYAITRSFGREQIYVWLMKDHKQATLRLEVPAEKHGLQLGTVFKAEFKLFKETFTSSGPVSGVDDDYFVTRENGKGGGIDVRVFAECLEPANNDIPYPWIYHKEFGYILDNRGELKLHIRAMYHMWIRRVGVMVNGRKEFRWAVLEQVLEHI